MYFRCSTSDIFNERAEDILIVVENVNVMYAGNVVLKNISLVLGKGLHLLIGKNGSGKSTLLKTIAGIVKPSRGRVTVFDRDIHKLSRKEAVKLVGYVWQNPYAGFLEVSVKDELEFSERIAGSSLNWEIVEILIPKNLFNRSPFTLSGGEAKRVSIASILALDQPVWLLDEPFDYLDSEGVEAVLKVIEYGLEKRKVIVVASANTAYFHMLRVDSVFLLYNGEMVFEGKIEDLNNYLLKKFGVPSKAMMCG
jgi:energy-coupling factor transport system ATP-binding protein